MNRVKLKRQGKLPGSPFQKAFPLVDFTQLIVGLRVVEFAIDAVLKLNLFCIDYICIDAFRFLLTAVRTAAYKTQHCNQQTRRYVFHIGLPCAGFGNPFSFIRFSKVFLPEWKGLSRKKSVFGLKGFVLSFLAKCRGSGPPGHALE